jgi:hypothetical protein
MRASVSQQRIYKELNKTQTNCSSSSPLGPKPVRDAAEVVLDGPDDVSVLCAGASAAVDNSGEADQQGGQGAAAAQQPQPFAAKESLVLQRHTHERALRQHGPQQRVVLQNARRHAEAAKGEKSRCGAECTRHKDHGGAVRLRAKVVREAAAGFGGATRVARAAHSDCARKHRVPAKTRAPPSSPRPQRLWAAAAAPRPATRP